MRLNSGSPSIREAGLPFAKWSWRYCFEAIQRPTHPADRLNDPEPPAAEYQSPGAAKGAAA
jgi:hypothetical protein